MIGVLLATDSDAVYNEVDAALASDDVVVWRVREGADVLPVIIAKDPQLVVLDLQIGNMGGVATCIAIRQEEGFYVWKSDRWPFFSTVRPMSSWRSKLGPMAG